MTCRLRKTEDSGGGNGNEDKEDKIFEFWESYLSRLSFISIVGDLTIESRVEVQSNGND